MPNLVASASNLRAALLRREFSVRDLLGATLAAIERLNPALNAIVQMDAAVAWRAATDSDSRLARGEVRPLEGLPVTIKDCFEVAGLPRSALPRCKITSPGRMQAPSPACAARERSFSARPMFRC
jgi:amidase